MNIVSVIVLIFNLIVLIGVSIYIGMLQYENQKRYIKMQEEVIKRFKQNEDIIRKKVDEIFREKYENK